ncbi:MAG: signal peptidase I [Silvanigrellaceae bacterium]|nr:signal peptidase I [Silvanigrellaceae bacterium]
MKKLILTIIFIITFYFFVYEFGISFGINVTESMPRGIYIMYNYSFIIKNGDIITFCPDEKFYDLYYSRGYLSKIKNGKCYGKYSEFIKKVIGTSGDKIEINLNELIVNGTIIKNSNLYDYDRDGRKLYHLKNGFSKFLLDDEVFVFSNGVKYSLDSRYIGIIKLNKINKKALFIWGF